MDKEKLLLLKKYLNKECSLDYLSSAFDMSLYEIMGMIHELKNTGQNILSVKRDGVIYIINYGDNVLENDSSYTLVVNNNKVNFMVISDTRLCSKYEQLTILNDIYKKAISFDVEYVLHCGDISEGIYKGSKGIFNETLFMHGTYEQGKYISDNYPSVEGIKTLFITGEHDNTHLSSSKVDIGKIIDDNRKDMVYLGKRRKKIVVKNEKGENLLDLLMLHPTGKIPYTISYKPQRYISAMRSEDKTNIIFHGHWLQTERLNYRGVLEFSVPSVTATTPEMDLNGDQNTNGAWLVNVEFGDKYKNININSMFIPYYQTIENDYKYAKTLKIGGR